MSTKRREPVKAARRKAMLTALYYASMAPGHVIIVIPESSHGVYWGPYSSQPRDHETTLDCKFYLKGLAFCRKGDTLYVLAEEMER